MANLKPTGNLGVTKAPTSKADQIETTADESVSQHTRSDVDASKKSQHHTLGSGANQSAPGNHIHDGVTGKKLGLYELDPGNPGQVRPALVLTGAKGGNVALTNLIALLKNFVDFRDTTT